MKYFNLEDAIQLTWYMNVPIRHRKSSIVNFNEEYAEAEKEFLNFANLNAEFPPKLSVGCDVKFSRRTVQTTTQKKRTQTNRDHGQTLAANR